jgi:hypothetical protein
LSHIKLRIFGDLLRQAGSTAWRRIDAEHRGQGKAMATSKISNNVAIFSDHRRSVSEDNYKPDESKSTFSEL